MSRYPNEDYYFILNARDTSDDDEAGEPPANTDPSIANAAGAKADAYPAVPVEQAIRRTQQ